MNFLEKVERLPENVKTFFVSDEVRLRLEKACFLYGLPSEKIKNISKEVGLIFVGDVKLTDLPNLIAKNLALPTNVACGIAFEINRLIFSIFPEYFLDAATLLDRWKGLKSGPAISEDAAWKKVLELEPWILEEEKAEAKRKKDEELKLQQFKASLIKITLGQALKTYPELGEQLITSDKITLKNFPSPVRPSIKNWLADYNFVVGFDKKEGSIGRTNYLFHNINTQKLSQPNRQKLSYILKSFDENSPITINKNTQQVVFPELQVRPAPPLPQRSAFQPQPRPTSQPFAPPKPAASPPEKKFETGNNPPSGEKGGPDVRFTYPQKLPYEKEKSPALQPYRIIPLDNSPKEKLQDNNSQASKNIINLKE